MRDDAGEARQHSMEARESRGGAELLQHKSARRVGANQLWAVPQQDMLAHRQASGRVVMTPLIWASTSRLQ